MKHYFRPGREDFRAAILKAMPRMLAEGGAHGSAKEEMREIIEGLSATTLKHNKVRLFELLERI